MHVCKRAMWIILIHHSVGIFVSDKVEWCHMTDKQQTDIPLVDDVTVGAPESPEQALVRSALMEKICKSAEAIQKFRAEGEVGASIARKIPEC